MPRTLTIKTSCHKQMCIEEVDFTKAEHAILHRILRNQWMTSDDYKIKQKCHPFFQGGHDRDEGWALIEFWTNDRDACQAFVDYVNAEFAKETL